MTPTAQIMIFGASGDLTRCKAGSSENFDRKARREAVRLPSTHMRAVDAPTDPQHLENAA